LTGKNVVVVVVTEEEEEQQRRWSCRLPRTTTKNGAINSV
jgi:hypothetical protein